MTANSIRKSLTVPIRPADAFRLFTEGFGDWWPGASHSVSAAKGAKPREIRVTPREGGHITEVKADGELARWATITVFEPGRRLAFDWYLGRNEEDATQVEVTFTPVDTGTRVELTHDGFDRLGEVAVAVDYAVAWDFVLGRYRLVVVRNGALIIA
jgi:uncharacterized protein YndB with AHSA1/START domain